MNCETERKLETYLISYGRIATKLKEQCIKTKAGKEITNKELRYAINIMEKKHSSCRWKCQLENKNKHYILIEGYYWLKFVYFQTEKNLIDADIDFFINRIKQYEELLKIQNINFWQEDIYVDELEKYFNRAKGTIKNNLIKLRKYNSNFIVIKNGKMQVLKEGIEWLCKNCFKSKYLELLERRKIELTEKYINAGYIYDVYL